MSSNDEKILNDLCLVVFNDIVKHYRISYREIERMLSYFAILHNMLKGHTTYAANYQYIIAFVCFLKATKPNLLKIITDKNYDKFIKESGLGDIDEQDKTYSLSYIKNLIIYFYSDLETKSKMTKDEIIYLDKHSLPPNLLLTITSWFSEINNM